MARHSRTSLMVQFSVNGAEQEQSRLIFDPEAQHYQLNMTPSGFLGAFYQTSWQDGHALGMQLAV